MFLYNFHVGVSPIGCILIYVVHRHDVCPVGITYIIIELLFVFVEAVFVAPRTEELGIAT